MGRLRERLRTASVPSAALLPVRLFFGLTFVYAGLDKLASPTFFDAASPTSIQAQLHAFARASPIAPLVTIAEPFAVPIGLLIALAEIAVGLGALTGLAFRLAAAGGAVLSLLFWLTASWATHPFYYGADLPYAAGWIALAVAGHGNLLVPARFTSPPEPSPEDEAARRRRQRRGEPVPAAPSPARRTFLQVGILAVIAVAASSLAAQLRGFAGLGESGARSATPEPSAGPLPTPLAGLAVAKIADVEQRTAVAFTVPFDAPAPLPAGDPGVIVRLSDGRFVAFDALCTHEACTVEWDARDSVLVCPCHGAAFDAADQGAVLAGPTNQPLASLPIVADPVTGELKLRV